jgi:hypothetical protein
MNKEENKDCYSKNKDKKAVQKGKPQDGKAKTKTKTKTKTKNKAKTKPKAKLKPEPELKSKLKPSPKADEKKETKSDPVLVPDWLIDDGITSVQGKDVEPFPEPAENDVEMSGKSGNVGGRPSAFDEETQRKVEKLYLRGFVDADVADIIGVDISTLYNWRKNYPEYFNNLKNWKDHADRNVERSLYERACGYTYIEQKTLMAQGQPQTIKERRHCPPDPASMIFWLKNRQPAKWRDKVEYEHEFKRKLVVLDD